MKEVYGYILRTDEKTRIHGGSRFNERFGTEARTATVPALDATEALSRHDSVIINV